MFPLIHKPAVKYMAAFLTAFVLAGSSCAEISAAQEKQNALRICEEGRYLVFSTDEYEMTLLDPEGNEHCRFHLNYGYGNGMWVDENAVLTGYSGGNTRVYSVSKGKEIASFPEDVYVSSGPGFFYSIDAENGDIRVYDAHGTMTCEAVYDLSGDDGAYLYDQLRELPEGWLLFFHKGSKYGAIILDHDLKLLEYVTDPFFLKSLSEYQLQIFGKYFAISGNHDLYELYRRDGTRVENLQVELIHEEVDPAGLLSHIYIPRSRFALKPTDAGKVVIDEELNETDLKVERTGIRSYVFADAKRAACRVLEGQELYETHERFYVTKETDNSVYYLRRYDDESFLIRSDEIPCVCDAGAAVSLGDAQGAGYRKTYRTVDNNGNEAGYLERIFLYGPAGDCVIASRGIYMGVMDLTGRWVWKYTWQEM